MAYTSSHRHVSGPRVGRTVALCVLLAAVFGGSVYAFRRMAAARAAQRVEQNAVAERLVAKPAPPSVTAAVADLVDVEKGGGSGQAARDAKDDRAHVTLRASLPAIDRVTTSYEGWLVSRLPFGYVRLGELVTDDAGAFVIEWVGAADKDYTTYQQVIITRQPKAENADPGTRVVEGTFAP